jgi:hypothetical protein
MKKETYDLRQPQLRGAERSYPFIFGRTTIPLWRNSDSRASPLWCSSGPIGKSDFIAPFHELAAIKARRQTTEWPKKLIVPHAKVGAD